MPGRFVSDLPGKQNLCDNTLYWYGQPVSDVNFTVCAIKVPPNQMLYMLGRSVSDLPGKQNLCDSTLYKYGHLIYEVETKQCHGLKHHKNV